MSGDWLMQMMSERWFPAVVTYFLGMLTGWLIWSGRLSSEHKPGDENANAYRGTNAYHGDELDGGTKDANTDEPSAGEAPAIEKRINGKEPVSMKLGALESELNKARKLLADADEDNAVFSELLGGLDEAVKRANGRLKLIMKSIKRAKIND